MDKTSDITGISILIRTFNSSKTLGRVLSKLKLETGDEYIVVDSGSTDSTLSIAASAQARIVHTAGPFNYSKSLNLGFRAASNPWILVLSSHAIPVVPDLLEEYRVTIPKLPSKVVVVYGPSTLDGAGYRIPTEGRYYSRLDYNEIHNLIGNSNTLYRKSIWDEVPFDETIRTSEDKFWLAEVVEKGYMLGLASTARTINCNHYSLRYMFWKGYSDQRAAPHRRMTLWELALGLGSLGKRFLFTSMPVGNFIRWSAQHFGSYFGSYQEQDNTVDRRD